MGGENSPPFSLNLLYTINNKAMKTLKNYFYNEMGKNNELIGLSVKTNDGENFFINDFDQFCDSDNLPREVLIGKKQGSIYGRIINTNELFIDSD